MVTTAFDWLKSHLGVVAEAVVPAHALLRIQTGLLMVSDIAANL